MEEKDVLHGTSPLLPQTHSRPGQAVKSLSFVREEQLPSLGTGGHGLVQSLHNHCLVTLAWREWGGTLQPFTLPRGGERKASSSFCLQPSAWGHSALCSSVVLPWGQPETPPGWHMLVGEERTEG